MFYRAKLPSLSFKEASSSMTTFLLTGNAGQIRRAGLISLCRHIFAFGKKTKQNKQEKKEPQSTHKQPVMEEYLAAADISLTPNTLFAFSR